MIKEEAIEHGKEALEVFGGEHREFIELAIECIENQMLMARKLSDIEEVIYDYCDTMVYKIIMEKIADILGVELIQIGLE